MDNSSLNRRKSSSSTVLTNPLLANESVTTISMPSAIDSTPVQGRDVNEEKKANQYSNFGFYKTKLVFLRGLYCLLARRKLILGEAAFHSML